MLALIQKPGQVDKPLNKVSSTGSKCTQRYNSIKITTPFNQKSIINNINNSNRKINKNQSHALERFLIFISIILLNTKKCFLFVLNMLHTLENKPN